MRKFKVSVQFMMTDEVEIEAEDLDDAMQKVDDEYEPSASKTAIFLNDSVEIDEDTTLELNEDDGAEEDEE